LQVQSTGKLKFEQEEFAFCAEDLVDCGEIGRGNFGAVNKMRFRKAGRVMAVKRIR
jgi:mitogen-activated protein kinase kinase 4